MVFHYVNFIAETNAWWLRRIRPLWMIPSALWVVWAFYRWYFFGKVQAFWHYYHGEEEMKRRALEDKRNWGYNNYYKPALKRSIKKQMMEEQGENYRFAEAWPERFMHDNRTLEEIMQEEENYE